MLCGKMDFHSQRKFPIYVSRLGHLVQYYNAYRSIGFNSVTISTKEYFLDIKKVRGKTIMIQMSTILYTVDTTTVTKVKAIQIWPTAFNSLGAKLVAAVQEVSAKGKYKRGDVIYGTVVRIKQVHRIHSDGTIVRFLTNDIIVVNEKGEADGRRVRGCLPLSLRKLGHGKILTLGRDVLR
jgi:large subunit ribosomal protein L14